MTKILAAIEGLLATIMEGAVERWFRVRVQPAHIARRVERALEEGALVGVDGMMAPNHFTVRLDSRTHERLKGVLRGLQRDLERHLVSVATRRRTRNVEPFEVEIDLDRSLAENTFTVQAEFRQSEVRQPVAAGVGGGDVIEHTMPMAVLASTPNRPPALLELRAGDGRTQTFPLAGIRCTIGRAPDNDVVLDETAVSRHHAAVRLTGDSYLVEDLGSTNGLLVNGKPVRTAIMRDGDRLHVGAAEFVFKQR